LEEKDGEFAACLKYSVLIVVEKKYIKCNICRVAVRPSYIQDARFLKVNVQGSAHNNNILIYMSNKMHMLQNLFYLTTALHVSGVTITHLQEYKTTVTTASGNRYTVLFSAVIVEDSRSSTIAADNNTV
jgi:hypothetical protein